MNFVNRALANGGKIVPLIISADKTGGTGLFNPSVINVDGRIFANIRHCQYTLYHSEKGKYEHPWGPLCYLHPENDVTLTTTNYLLELDEDLNIKTEHKVDTSALDVKPLWEFIGLEDCRLVHWDDKMYLSGVRRDTTTNGEGRMELSEIKVLDNSVSEVSRFRIPTPTADYSYCEKNWMPVQDMPYHYVKWSNPTDVVRVDPMNKTCSRVFLSTTHVPKPYDYRGGSQVITLGNYRICLAHIVNLFKSKAGRKNGTYRHVFIIWDKDWNVVKYTEPFDFMGGEIEFVCGMTRYKNDMLISFGFQDNAAYLLKVPVKFIEDFINE